MTQMKKETNEKNSFVHEKRVNICTKHSSIEYYGVVIVLKTADHRYSKYANVIALITLLTVSNCFIVQLQSRSLSYRMNETRSCRVRIFYFKLAK